MLNEKDRLSLIYLFFLMNRLYDRLKVFSCINQAFNTLKDGIEKATTKLLILKPVSTIYQSDCSKRRWFLWIGYDPKVEHLIATIEIVRLLARSLYAVEPVCYIFVWFGCLLIRKVHLDLIHIDCDCQKSGMIHLSMMKAIALRIPATWSYYDHYSRCLAPWF